MPPQYLRRHVEGQDQKLSRFAANKPSTWGAFLRNDSELDYPRSSQSNHLLS